MAESPYKIVNELEKEIEVDYSATILNLSKELLSEIDKEIKIQKEK